MTQSMQEGTLHGVKAKKALFEWKTLIFSGLWPARGPIIGCGGGARRRGKLVLLTATSLVGGSKWQFFSGLRWQRCNTPPTR